MLIRILVCLIMLLIAHSLIAQQQPEEDFISERADRKVYHYIGLQANQLIRQVLSFGGGSSAINNPYLLTYSMNSKQNGIGFSLGLGYSKIDSKSSDIFSSTISKITDFNMRLGVEKKAYLSKRWLVGFGGDFIISSNRAETTTNNGGNPNPRITTTNGGKGFGPRVSINYQFHDRLMVGTEASFYMKWSTEDQKVVGQQSSPNPSTDLRSFGFTMPAAIFLIAKL